MNHERLIAELSRAALAAGVSVRCEPLWGKHPGGLCQVRGRPLVLLNSEAPAVERLFALADALAACGLSGENLTLAARALLRRRAERRSDVIAPVTPPLCGLAKTKARDGKRRRL